jgi:hypothetical protein
MTVLDESPTVLAPPTISFEEWLTDPNCPVGIAARPEPEPAPMPLRLEDLAPADRERREWLDSLTPGQRKIAERPVELPSRSKIRRAIDELYDRPDHLSDSAWMTLAAVVIANSE